jgi:hypothetical protein
VVARGTVDLAGHRVRGRRARDDVLIARGPVTIVDDPTELAAVDELSRRKYVDPHSGATAGFPQSPTDVPYRIDVERVAVWEYGVVATRSDFTQSAAGWVRVPLE